MKSTQSAAMALRGIPSYFADRSSWQNVMPPPALIAFSPRVPSVALPERITPMALFPSCSARDPKKIIDGHLRAPPDTRQSRKAPPETIRFAFGEMTYT